MQPAHYRIQPTLKLNTWVSSPASLLSGVAKSSAMGAAPIIGIEIRNPAPTATR